MSKHQPILDKICFVDDHVCACFVNGVKKLEIKYFDKEGVKYRLVFFPNYYGEDHE